MTIDRIETESVGVSVFSPLVPWDVRLSPTARTICSNVASIGEMVEQFRHLWLQTR